MSTYLVTTAAFPKQTIEADYFTHDGGELKFYVTTKVAGEMAKTRLVAAFANTPAFVREVSTDS